MCWRHSPKPCPRCPRWTQGQTVICASPPSPPSTSVTSFRFSSMKVPGQPHVPLQALDTGALAQLTSSRWTGQARPGVYGDGCCGEDAGMNALCTIITPKLSTSLKLHESLHPVSEQRLRPGHGQFGPLFKMKYRCA